MAAQRYDPEAKGVLDSMLLDDIEVEPGQAFGFPAYYVNGKMFACLYEEGVAIKVPPDMVEELLERPSVGEFRPLGRHRMKQWVLLTRGSPEEYRGDLELLLTAKEHVHLLSLQG